MGDIKRLLLLLLWVGLTVSTAVDLQKRIVGGQECEPDERQYHVKFTFLGGLECGGSLINESWILTAAHCRKILPRAHLDVHPGPGNKVFITSLPKTFKEKVNIFKKKEHDLMLLKLRTPVSIQPVFLPTEQECETRHSIPSFQIAGHASTTMGPNNERGDDVSPTLQCGNIDQVDCSNFLNCLEINQPKFFKKHGIQDLLCGQSRVVDISLGDSGGGVVHNGKLYGVISFTGNGKRACVAPAAFMDVCKYMPWIKKTAGIP